MDNMKYLAVIELASRQGNMNLPLFPRGELEAFLFDQYTQTKVPIELDATNVINIHNKTCGCLQWLSVANLLVWSSFESKRFTLYVQRVAHRSESTSALKAVELCK